VIVKLSTIEEEFEKAQVKGFVRTRRGKLERVSPFERAGVAQEKPKTFDVGREILKELELISTPRGFGGFGLDYIPSWDELTITYDTPREIRHEDEYFDSRRERSDAHAKVLSQWNSLDSQVFDIKKKFELKYPGIKIETGGGVWGKDVVHIRHARNSEFVISKSRTPGSKDKQKRKRRLTTGKDWGSLPKARAMTANEKKYWKDRASNRQKESAFIPKNSNGSITQSSQHWLDRNRDFLD